MSETSTQRDGFMNKPKVSVIIPCYGVEKYLNRCLTSTTNQSIRDIEIILVDDGSPDKVPQMCDDWASKDERIRVIHKQNAGLGFARNSGLDVAQGEYIAFLDSDDFVDLKMYEALYTTAIEKNADAVFCGFRKEFKPNVFVDVRECSEYTEYMDENVKALIPDFIAAPPYSKKEYKFEMSVWHSIYKNDLIQKHNLRFISEREFASEDIPFQIDFLTYAKKIGFIPDILHTYCFNGGSLTKKVSFEKYEKIKNLYKLLFEKSKAFDPDGLRAKRLFIGYIRAYIRKWVSSTHSYSKKIEVVNTILYDDIWAEFREVYSPNFLPSHQKMLLNAIYKKQVFRYFWLTKILEMRFVTKLKSLMAKL